MKIDRLMATDVAAVRPETDVRTAVGEMRLHECGFLPVLDDDGKVVGVVTDRDVALALGTDDARPSERLVADAMTWQPQTCRSDETVARALHRMREFRVRRLPVVNAAGRLVGAISIDDLVGSAQNVRAGTDRVSFEQVMEAITVLAARPRRGGAIRHWRAHGGGPIEHMLLGSVAEQVVRKAPCPVLTVRRHGHTFVMPAT